MKRQSIKKPLLIIATGPVIVLAIIIIAFATTRFEEVIHSQVSKDLEDVASSVKDMLDFLYPGDYIVVGENSYVLAKGETPLNERFEFIDAIKEDTGMEVTIFYDKIRFLTTLRDNNHNRLLGSFCNASIENAVISNGSSAFYTGVDVNGSDYFAYYLPLFNSDGSCVGMIGVAKPTEEVKHAVFVAVFPIILIAVIAAFAAGLISFRYSSRLADDMMKLNFFMKDVSQGNLKSQIEPSLIRRDDEITEMARSATSMQRDLRKLIELDPLTELDNRRSAAKYIIGMQQELKENGEIFSIALGDIDFFKKVNDTYGHDAGDDVLKMVATILRAHLKGKGFAARWGGEEFLLGFWGYGVEDATVELENILNEIREAVVVNAGREIKITMSFGVAPGNCDWSIDALVKVADDKLYYAKEHGRNQIVSMALDEAVENPDSKVRSENRK